MTDAVEQCTHEDAERHLHPSMEQWRCKTCGAEVKALAIEPEGDDPEDDDQSDDEKHQRGRPDVEDWELDELGQRSTS